MKFSHVLPLAALSSAIVLPPEQVLSGLAIEDHHHDASLFNEAAATKNRVVGSVKEFIDDLAESSWDAIRKAAHSTEDVMDHAYSETADFVDDMTDDVQSWLESSELLGAFNDGGHHGPPHHPPGHGPPGHGPPDHRPDHGRKPHHPPCHGKPNQTVYQLIANSKYTTKLAKLISEYDDLVETLNSTAANYTVFAPTDAAFEKIPEHAPKPSKEQLKALLTYHVVPDFYPAGKVLTSLTAPTLLQGKRLGDSEFQRIAFKIGLRGITVNFYSRIVAIDIFGTNGVVHGIDSILIPPPRATAVLDLFPGEFSTLELGLTKTGLYEKLNVTDGPGGTLFAPNNWAFKKLGPRINAFLFSSHGEKYLKALLEYHIAPENILYSDAFYPAKSSDAVVDNVPRGQFHVDLPTALEGHSLSIDIARWARFLEFKINGFSRVAVNDVIARDGVVHVLRSVLIPPKTPGGRAEEVDDDFDMTVEEFQARFDAAPESAKWDL